MPPERDHEGDRKRDCDVAEDRHDLRACDLGRQLGDAIQRLFASARFLGRRCDPGGGHRRLLGGDREVQQMHDDEAGRVVHAEQECLPEGRQVQRSEPDLDQGHRTDDDAGTGGRAGHRPVFGARGGDVVLTGPARVFGHLQRQQIGAAQNEITHAVSARLALDEIDQQRPARNGARVGIAVAQHEQQHRHPADRCASAQHQARQGDAGALLARQLAGAQQSLVALVQQHGEVAGGVLVQPRPRALAFRSRHVRAARGRQAAQHLVGLREERRTLVWRRCVVAQQFGIHAQSRQAMREHPQRLQGLGAQHARCACAEPVGFLRPFCIDVSPQHLDQPGPSILPCQCDPVTIVPVCEDFADQIDPVQAVRRLRQDAQACPPEQFGQKALPGFDPGLGQQVPLGTPWNQPAEQPRDGAGQGRVRRERGAQRIQTGDGGVR